MTRVDPSERARLRKLHQFGLLDTGREDLFDAFAHDALRIVPQAAIAAVSLVDADRVWFKAEIGLGAEQVCRDIGFCDHTIRAAALVVPDLSVDPRFCANPLVRGAPYLRFYAGVRLVHAIGALCVLATAPVSIADWQLSKLIQLAQYLDIQLLARGAIHLSASPLPS